MQPEQFYISDTVDNTILDANFNDRKGIAMLIDGTVRAWGQVDKDGNVTNQAGLKSAIKVLYQAINLPEEMQKSIEILSRNPDYKGLIEGLKKLSAGCNGKIRADNKTLFDSCRRIYDKLSDEQLEDKIREYFKDKSNSYLREKSPHIFDELERASQRQSSGQTIN